VNFDLIVVGGGPVGASLACAVRGLALALVAPARPAPPAREALDQRVYAINPANVRFLEALGVWRSIPPERTAPIHAMRVFGDDGASVIEFDAYSAGVPELAHTVEDAVLQQALWRALEGREGVSVLAPAECERLEFRSGAVTLLLREAGALEARLVVGADGARSFVRERAGIPVREEPYAQRAVAANFACEREHRGTAYQWFQGGPVLALLPLQGRRVSMIWSLPEEEAARLCAHDADALCRALEIASHGVLGGFSSLGAPKSYPLQRLAASRLVAPRVALAGDAAHVIHPLAGQGANLGLQDARVLAETLAAREPVRDPGELRLLRRYARARAEPVWAMDAMVHGLYRLFGARGRGAAQLRNIGLNLTDRVPVVKNLLMRHAMG
jgi:ubiquinone biosynthesis UbiH/UbiF/VisC/COQ6 family hydroxylase